MARTATGIDIGTSTAKLLRGEVKGNSFVVHEFVVAPNEGGTVTSGWEALGNASKPKVCRIGLTGREINMRYTRVPRVPDWQLRKLMHFEAQEIASQSEAEVASDFNVLPELPEIDGEDVVVLCMARESLLEEHSEGLASLGGQLNAFTPNAIALYNAFLHYGVVMEDTVLLANIGRDNVDVILMRGTDLLFARNLNGGSRLFDQAIVERFNISEARAEEFKIDECSLRPHASFKDPNAEKASRAMMGPAGQILSLLQSTVLFAKNQIKLSSLKLDRVFLCGGGAALDGFPEYLANGLGVPVEPFDPFIVVDVSKLSPEAASQLEDHKLEAVCALGLATCASDPDAYGIELLPSAVRKKRDFLSGPAFLIAAAALALLYLGLSAWHQNKQLNGLEGEAHSVGRRLRTAKRNNQATLGLIDENRGMELFASELFALAGSGEQTVRTIAAIEKTIPEGFWLESMTSTWGSDEELGVTREVELPILRFKGRAREGTSAPSLLFEEFVGALQELLPTARIKHRMGATQTDFTLDLTLLAPPPEVAELDEDDEEGGEG